MMGHRRTAGDWTTFRTWIYSSGLAIRKGAAVKKVTHLCLNGAKINVPPERESEFRLQYARSLSLSEPLYVVEMKTDPVYYFMAEFDIKTIETPINLECALELVNIIQTRVMSRAFPENDVSVLMFTVEPKSCKLSNGMPAVQSGIHLIWKIPVVQETAMRLRGWIMREFDSRAAFVRSVVPWQEAYDPCVYDKNGLRMVGARKAERCKACVGEGQNPKEPCVECGGLRYFDCGRPYSFSRAIDREGVVDLEKTSRLSELINLCELVDLSTIRVSPGVTDVKISYADSSIRIQSSEWLKCDMKMFRNKPEKTQAANKPVGLKDTKGGFADTNPQSPEYKECVKLVNKVYGASIVTTNVLKTENGAKFIVHTKSHSCENKKGDHGSSNVYYQVSVLGICQRCFCKKVYADGPCHKFYGQLYKLDDETKMLIFPNSKPKKMSERKMHQLTVMSGAIVNRSSSVLDALTR